MKILAISGSTRIDSSNTQLLKIAARMAPAQMHIEVFDGLVGLPIFSPDLEGDLTPPSVNAFCQKIVEADGVIISCPEYVHAIPGGLKNAIDWLVQREQIIAKPVALLHASHRGEDLLASLRLVLRTVTQNFQEDNFAQFSLVSKDRGEVENILSLVENQKSLVGFLKGFEDYVEKVMKQAL